MAALRWVFETSPLLSMRRPGLRSLCFLMTLLLDGAALGHATQDGTSKRHRSLTLAVMIGGDTFLALET